MRWLRTLSLIAGALLIVAQFGDVRSQEPISGPDEQGQPPQQYTATDKVEPSANHRGTPDLPFVIQILPGPGREPQATGNGEKHDDKPSPDDRIADYTFILAWLTGGLVFVGILQGGTLLMQFFQLRRTNKATEKIERAYITMSHKKFTLGEKIPIPMQFQNHGRTPGTLTEAIAGHAIIPKDDPAPTAPKLSISSPESGQRSFLVPNEIVFGGGAEINLTKEQVNGVGSGSLILWYWGHVDYIDVFGKRHRYGYARIFDKRSGDLIIAGGDKLNYDREREKCEGNDWDQ